VANYSQTSSGDLTSYVAGKIFSAANLAKEEKERRKEEGIEQAQPGSLFARALQHEFGGDLYNRTFGIFDPRKKHPETDRKSSKESRFSSQFPQKEKTDDSGTKKRKNKITAATRELMSDDDSLPVKDKDLRKQISKIFGAGVDARLVAAEAKISKINAQVLDVHHSLQSTQELIINQNDILLSKFDQILEIFGKQAEFQEKLKDKAEAAEKERIIEEQKDLSSTRGLIDTSAMTGGTSVPSRVARFYKNRAIRRLYRKLPKSVRQTRTTVRNIQRAPGRAVNRVSQQITTRLPRQANQAAQTLSKAKGIGQLGRTTGPLRYAFAGMEYADRKNAGQNELQALSGVGSGLAGAAAGGAAGAKAGAIIGGSIGALFGGVGAAPGALIGGIIGGIAGSITGGLAAGKVSDTVTGVHETGTSLTKKGTGLLHGKELILGSGDRKGIKNAFVDSMDKMGSQLVSTAVTLGESAGQGKQIRSEAKKLGLDYKIISISLKTNIGKKTPTSNDKLISLFTNPFSVLREQAEAAGEEAPPGLPEGQRYKLGDNAGGSAELRAEVEKAAAELGVPAPDLLGIILAESGGDPSKPNKYGCVGLIQFCPDDRGGSYKTIGGEKVTLASLRSMSIAQQMVYVKKYLKGVGIKPGMSGYDIYSAIHAGSIGGNVVDANGVTTRGFYDSNVAPLIQKARQESTIVADLGNFSPPTGDARIVIAGGQGIDATGESGIDFSAADSKNNYAVFPGKVISSQYTGGLNQGYGWDVVIRSEDPSNPGTYFDALYAHFPNKDSIKVKPGDTVTAGTHLGPVGWDYAKNKPFPEAGRMTGPHTSLDFFPAGGPYNKNNPYPNWRTLVSGLMAAAGRGGSNVPVSTQPGGNSPAPSGAPNPATAAAAAAAQSARQLAITKQLMKKGMIEFTHDGKQFFFKVLGPGKIQAFKPKNMLGYQQEIDLSRNKALRLSINEKIQTMYGRPSSGPTSRGYGNGGTGGDDSGAVTSKTSLIRGGTGGPGTVNRNYNFTAEQRALLKTISYAEGTTKSYGVVYGGNIVPELAQGKMTVREVWNMMKTGRLRGRNAGYDASGESYATGRYQLMPDTLSDLVKGGYVKWSEKMTNQLQDYLALKRLETFRGVSGRDLRQQGLSTEIMSKIAPEFASFPYAPKGGGSFYDQPVKSEKTLQQQYNSALKQILEEQRRQEVLREKLRLKKEAQEKNIFNQIQKILPGGLKGLIPSQLLSDSSVLESMEENAIQTQFVIINNQMVASADMSKNIIISPSSEVDVNELYRMAVLGV